MHARSPILVADGEDGTFLLRKSLQGTGAKGFSFICKNSPRPAGLLESARLFLLYEMDSSAIFTWGARM